MTAERFEAEPQDPQPGLNQSAHLPWMALAARLATAGREITPPNPSVGCIIVGTTGSVLGQGHTQPPGGRHAEIMALDSVAAQGHSAMGATAYVTLEPCSHHGRTGPCCDALIAAGIKKVVACMADPNPLVSGKGFERLRAAGIDVEVGPGADEARELNIGFFSRMVRKTPWVRLKVAASLDGRTALPNGQSQWITSETARQDGHAWRARAGAILTGIGTVLDDNPRLDVRLAGSHRQPDLVVVDSRLQTPLDARLFEPARRVLIYCALQDGARIAALQAKGATVITMPGSGDEQPNKVDLKAMLRDLARREFNDLHVEAGHKLNGSFIREGLVDEMLIYLAPKLIGEGAGIADFGVLKSLGDVRPMSIKSVDRVGEDLRIVARFTGADQF